jgi:hypothetical protein
MSSRFDGILIASDQIFLREVLSHGKRFAKGNSALMVEAKFESLLLEVEDAHAPNQPPNSQQMPFSGRFDNRFSESEISMVRGALVLFGEHCLAESKKWLGKNKEEKKLFVEMVKHMNTELASSQARDED